MVVVGQKLFYSGKSSCIRAKVVVFEQSGCIWVKVFVFGKLLYSGKMDVFGQSGCIQARRLYSRKVVVFGQKWLYWGKAVVLG